MRYVGTKAVVDYSMAPVIVEECDGVLSARPAAFSNIGARWSRSGLSGVLRWVEYGFVTAVRRDVLRLRYRETGLIQDQCGVVAVFGTHGRAVIDGRERVEVLRALELRDAVVAWNAFRMSGWDAPPHDTPEQRFAQYLTRPMLGVDTGKFLTRWEAEVILPVALNGAVLEADDFGPVCVSWEGHRAKYCAERLVYWIEK